MFSFIYYMISMFYDMKPLGNLLVLFHDQNKSMTGLFCTLFFLGVRSGLRSDFKLNSWLQADIMYIF